MIDVYDDGSEINKFSSEDEEEKAPKKREYLDIMFDCCNVYSRIYKNKEGTAYVGKCPKCFRTVTIKVGKGGTNQRFFNAY